MISQNLITKINCKLQNLLLQKKIGEIAQQDIEKICTDHNKSLKKEKQDIFSEISKKDFNVSIENIFTIVIYDENEKYEPNNSSNNYTNEGIRQQFTEYEKETYFSGGKNKHFYTYISICAHGNVIEVGMSQFPLSKNYDGDWVKKVELKNSNILFIDHIIEQLKNGMKINGKKKNTINGENILNGLNIDYKYMIVIPINNNDDETSEHSAFYLESILQQYFNIKLNKYTYFDKKEK